MKPFRFVFAAALLMLIASTAWAAPRAKITAYTVTSDNQLLVTITGEDGAKPVVAEKSILSRSVKPLIIGGGYAILYPVRGTKPGFEGETTALKYYDVNGYKKVLLDQGLGLDSVREVVSQAGHKLYVASMSDGGAGIPILYVVEAHLGTIWEKFAARMSGARNGKLVVALYSQGEEAGYEDAKPIGTSTIDLDRVRDYAYKYRVR